MATVGTPLPQQGRDAEKTSGHWLLARLGKRVLRPGGAELSRWLVGVAGVRDAAVVELAPGLGRTAQLLLDAAPASYVGVDASAEAAACAQAVVGRRGEVRHANADTTGLPDASADVVVGEAMLTMQIDEGKRHIVAESFRLLKPGGRYAIHELALVPDDVSGDIAEGVRDGVARSVRVNARPLTSREWQSILKDAGFTIGPVRTAPMALLEPRRLIADEGFVGALRFAGNVLRDRAARKRVLTMRRTFRRHRENLAAIGLVAVKPQEAVAGPRSPSMKD